MQRISPVQLMASCLRGVSGSRADARQWGLRLRRPTWCLLSTPSRMMDLPAPAPRVVGRAVKPSLRSLPWDRVPSCPVRFNFQA